MTNYNHKDKNALKACGFVGSEIEQLEELGPKVAEIIAYNNHMSTTVEAIENIFNKIDNKRIFIFTMVKLIDILYSEMNSTTAGESTNVFIRPGTV